ncbi:ABC transporter ATP-binding protein [Halomarina litorea]|uniref:ABC transporter ATP-binding protein n=1 Tax=Halomarina litorea TaxID=2961595 RepID=UPI0020C559AA|nr:ABC transporter ATP-binding protein [Halomarina sp. BCD28]
MLLTTKNLTKRFGGLVAVDDVTIEVQEGELRSVIGPNGAGKTTFFNLITGLLEPSEGEIMFNGDPITHEKPEARVKKGIARSFQVTNIFPGLSVKRNIRISLQNSAGYGRNFWSQVDGIESLDRRVDEIIDEIGITASPETVASTMSHGEKRLLEIALVVAQNPSIILLDEPAAGMSAEETREVVDLIRSLNEDYTIMLIEHDIDLIMELSDKITVLADGSVITEGKPDEVAANEDVQAAYLGGTV